MGPLAAVSRRLRPRNMPIYEFYCSDCHRIFSFLSRAVNTTKSPACPRCGRPELPRQPSSFAVSRGRPEPSAAADEAPAADDARMESAMASIAGEFEAMDEGDPRQMARLTRKLYGAAGMPVAGGLEEALRRMEAGEDPEKVEDEMGEVLGDDPQAAEATDGAPEPKGVSAVKRLRPPVVDSTLYEL
jgi:putative FmdB family regulatory protein